MSSRSLVPAAAALLSLAIAGCGQLDRDAVATEIDALQSSAAEGALLARQAHLRRAPENFVWIHSAELHKQAQRAAEKLGSAQFEPAAQEAGKKGAELGDKIQGQLEYLHNRAGDRDAAGRLSDALDQLADQAEKLGQQA